MSVSGPSSTAPLYATQALLSQASQYTLSQAQAGRTARTRLLLLKVQSLALHSTTTVLPSVSLLINYPSACSVGAWDAFRSEEWSYSDFLANRTHMWLRQRLATNGSIIDEMVLER